MSFTIEPKLHVSLNNSKLGDHIPSVNLVPGVSCRTNAPCFGTKGCYACKGRFKFANVQKSLWDNWALWANKPAEYMSGIIAAAKDAGFFRWHSAGDIPSPEYLAMMVWVAERCPTTEFLAFTKQTELVNAYLDAHKGILPKNLHIVFSHWGNEFVPYNPYNLPTAHVRFKDEGKNAPIPGNAFECPGFCGDCVKSRETCFKMKRGEAVVFNEH